jgi:hypothetical protein
MGAAALILALAVSSAQQPAPADPTEVLDTCLTCHADPSLQTTLASGEVLRLTVDGQTFAHSTHGKRQSCLDCHPTMEQVPHAPLAARSLREFRVASYEACKRCHFEHYTHTLDSAHMKGLARGDRNAPTCLGVSNEQPRFGRFDYKQKFEYWGLIMGGLVVGVTGLMLLYPIHVASVLSAQLIPVAKAAHSNEGLLAFLTIVTWHVYSAILSPEVFPLDKTIFTGRISIERMKHEHPLELAELVTRVPEMPEVAEVPKVQGMPAC